MGILFICLVSLCIWLIDSDYSAKGWLFITTLLVLATIISTIDLITI